MIKLDLTEDQEFTISALLLNGVDDKTLIGEMLVKKAENEREFFNALKYYVREYFEETGELPRLRDMQLQMHRYFKKVTGESSVSTAITMKGCFYGLKLIRSPSEGARYKLVGFNI